MRRVFMKGELEGYAVFARGVEGDMAKTILAERAEREKNPGVWDDAPEWADRVRLEWNASGGRFATTFQTYTRTLPKTKAREIADKNAEHWYPSGTILHTSLSNLLESAINEALGGEK